MSEAAWEWRIFAETPDLLPAIDLSGPVEERDEYDLYLVVPGSGHNVKVRGGGLEIKRLLQQGPSGLQLWQGKEELPFPLAREQVGMVGSLFGVNLGATGADRPEALIPILRRSCTNLATMAVWKRRNRWILPDGCRVETAMLTFPGGGSCWTLGIDGFGVDLVRSHLPSAADGVRWYVCGYVEMLQMMLGHRGEGERPPWATSFRSSVLS